MPNIENTQLMHEHLDLTLSATFIPPGRFTHKDAHRRAAASGEGLIDFNWSRVLGRQNASSFACGGRGAKR